MSNKKCHICNGLLLEIEGFSSLFQVTSDCRPWINGGSLAVCRDCGTVQKPITKKWLMGNEKIYLNYQIYNQGGGSEQSTFDQSTGAKQLRSETVVQWLAANHSLPETGKLLDVGCGNGAFLKAFGAYYKGWQMTGLELDSRNKQVIESIPGVESLYVGGVDGLNGRFDMIVLIHALEHISNPVPFLKSLSNHLSPEGLLLVETPNLETSPFDILIADHCTHFTENSLKRVVEEGGFQNIGISSDFVPKEISFLARQREFDGVKKVKTENVMTRESLIGRGIEVASSNIAWLQNFLQKGKEIEGKIGVFGTSISATWLAASLGDKVSFFVDEDENRIGHTHLNRPIINPRSIPSNSNILLPMRADIAAAIAKRLYSTYYRFIFNA